jgi:biotin carboxyl carrier protein
VTGRKAEVTVNGVAYSVDIEGNDGKSVRAPLPGRITEILVAPGDVVKEGQPLAVLEAMKMENDIQAEFDGTVTAVNVTRGDSVLEGAVIVMINQLL